MAKFATVYKRLRSIRISFLLLLTFSIFAPVILASAGAGLGQASSFNSSLHNGQLNDRNPQLADVSVAFSHVPQIARSEFLEPVAEGEFPKLNCHHVQSIQAYQNWFILSHSAPGEGFIAVVEPDGGVTRVSLDSGYSHAGGFQILGDMLVIALTDFANNATDCSNKPPPVDHGKWVKFYDIRDPYNPVALTQYDLEVADKDSQAAAAVNVGSEILVAVVTDTQELHFYSRNHAATEWHDEGKWFMPGTWPGDKSGDTCEPDYAWCWPQNINLIQQEDGKIYLLAFTDSGDREWVGLYTVSLLNGPKLTPVEDRFLNNQNNPFMHNGGGSAVTANGTLGIFSFGGHFCSSACQSRIAAWQDFGWGRSHHYDFGIEASIAIDDGEHVVQVHRGSSTATVRNLYYRVGKVDAFRRTVSWSDSRQSDTGANPAVAMDAAGRVVEAHNGTGSETWRNLYYRIGQADFNSNLIDWNRAAKWDTGANVSLALDDNGNIVELHNGTTNETWRNLYYRVGEVDFRNRSISWGPSRMIDTGVNVSVAIDNAGNVVEIHNGTTNRTNRNLYYRTGKLSPSTKSISWGNSINWDTGTAVSVQLDDAGNVLEVHNGTASTTRRNLYFRTGILDAAKREISWVGKYGNQWDTGKDIAIALGADGTVVETHNGTATENVTKLYYSVGDINLLRNGTGLDDWLAIDPFQGIGKANQLFHKDRKLDR